MGITLLLTAPHYLGRKVKGALTAISGGTVYSSETGAATSKREAHFVNIEGTVRVKKARSLQWIHADYSTMLEKGDFLQTGSNGFARLIFADGTNYMLKQDSLIVVEESGEDPVTRATRVAVQVSSGAVDLSTGKFEVAGSISRVSFADAAASLAEESRAVVRNDAKRNWHEFTINQGEAEVSRGATSIRLGQYEQVTFDATVPGLVQQSVIAPPTLLAPANMDLTMSREPKTTSVEFGWSEVTGAVAYHLQVSPSPIFSKFVVDKTIVGKTSVHVSGLDEATYYWAVSSIDETGVESQPSAANRFSLVQQVGAATDVLLEITRIVQHGSVVEVLGRTEPGSSVIINNEQVFSIDPDGAFRHFTSPFPDSGPKQITITVQNRKGGTRTIRRSIAAE